VETRNYTVNNASLIELEGPTLIGVADPGSWHDYYLDTQRFDDDGVSITFEVVAETSNPAGLGIYVFDQSSHSPDSEGVLMSAPPPDGPTTTIVHPEGKATIPTTAAAIDNDILSKIGNFTHRTYFAYIGTCYVMAGARYFLSVFGFDSQPVPFWVRALRVDMQLVLPPYVSSPAILDNHTSNDTFRPSNCSNASMPDGWCGSQAAVMYGSVCDGKYMHHFFDLKTVPPSGGIEIRVQKTSGELEGFYVRYERCAGPEGQAPATNSSSGNMFHINLFGHGLSYGNVKIPNERDDLLAGRYYISLRGSVEMCGDYSIIVKEANITLFNQESMESFSKRGTQAGAASSSDHAIPGQHDVHVIDPDPEAMPTRR